MINQQTSVIAKFFAVTFLVVLFSFGCKPKEKPRPEGLPDLVPCEITILLDGKKLPGALVTLKPLVNDPSRQTWTINGMTDSNGIAAIQTYGDFAGAPAGEYVVLVAKTERPEIPEDASMEENARLSAIPATVVVAPSYGDPELSELRITIPSQGRVSESFEVKGP